MSVLTNGHSRILDPSGRPYVLRDVYGDMALPHVLTFPALYGSAWKTYLHGKWDEALRHGREDALVMRRDAFLMALMQERKLATVSLKWHLEVDDEKDPYQKALKDGLTSMLRATKRLKQMKYYLLDGLWYGRYAAQVRWEWRTMDVPAVAFQPPTVGPFGAAPGGLTTTKQRRRYLHLAEHQPVNGDKIGHEWDGTPYVEIYAGAREILRELEGKGATFKFISSTEAYAMVLQGTWRERFLIHTHEVDDADYFDAERAGSLYGIGIRHRIYWLDWLKREYLAMVTDHIQRKGLGIDVWWYDAGNPAAERKMLEVAKEQSYRSIILLPRFANDAGRTPVNQLERIETNVSGAELLLKLQTYVDETIQRYIVGQTMSGGADDDSGLGGTGRAKFAANTKHKIIQWDAGNLDETLTEDWVSLVQRWSYPEYRDIPVRHVTNVPDEEAKDKLDAAKSAWEMGVDLVTNEVRGLTGLSDPQPGDEVLAGKAAGPALPPGMAPFGSQESGIRSQESAEEEGKDPEEEDEDLTPDSVGAPVPFGRGDSLLWYQATRKDLLRRLERAARETDPEPSDEQREAGNYRMGHVRLHNLDVTVEVPKGGIRSKVGKDGKRWERRMHCHYGYIKRTESDADGDHLDCYVGPHPESELVCVVNQVKENGHFDEHKIMLGFTSEGQARKAYLAHYPAGWKGLGSVACITMEEFKNWIEEGDTTRPVQANWRRGAYRYAKGGDCQWITIGGTKGADGQRKGGSPVCLQGGRIVKGHPSLTGKRIEALEEDGGEDGAAEPVPAGPPRNYTPFAGTSPETQAALDEVLAQVGADAPRLVLAGDVASLTKPAEWRHTMISVNPEQLRRAIGWQEEFASQRGGRFAVEMSLPGIIAHELTHGRVAELPEAEQQRLLAEAEQLRLTARSWLSWKAEEDAHEFLSELGTAYLRGHPLPAWALPLARAMWPRAKVPERAAKPSEQSQPAAPARPRHRLIEGDPSTHRQELAQSRAYARARWAKQARQAGIPPAHLHQLAADLIEHDREYAASLTRMLGEARRMSAGSGFGDLRTLAARARKGDIDASHIRGLDDVAAAMAASYPELFPDPERTDERLFELLLSGNPAPMGEEDAYQQAFEHLQARQSEPGATWETDRPTEEAPFQRAGMPAPSLGAGPGA